VKQLLRFNDLDAPIALQPGTVVYLERKKPQAEPGYGKYEVERDGMTLWDISQMFGIQLGKLRLYNAFRGSAPLEAGDTVLLRKF
jgi:LysM repeat protein